MADRFIYRVGRPLVLKVLFTFFRVPQAVGCTAAAMLPKQAMGTLNF